MHCYFLQSCKRNTHECGCVSENLEFRSPLLGASLSNNTGIQQGLFDARDREYFGLDAIELSQKQLNGVS